jgi:hypothetical protein
MILSNCNQPFEVRITGGCGYMTLEDGKRSVSVLSRTLRGLSCMLLYGGTRVLAPAPGTKLGYKVFPTILEVPPRLRRTNPNIITYGIIPKMTHVKYGKLGLVIGEDEKTGFLTVIHPNQDLCLILQKNVDEMSYWDAEWMECLEITKTFLQFRKKFAAVLVAYNGGKVTGHEIEAWAEEGLPVILFAGSGRITDEFCQNTEWLNSHPSVTVCHSVKEARQKIVSLGGVFA